MISHFFIDRPIFASVLSIVITLTGGDRAAVAADRPVPADHAAHRAGLDQLSRRQCPGGGRHGRRADRAAGQRRRGHALHVVADGQRRLLHPHRHLRPRHRPEHGAGDGAEPRDAGHAALPTAVQNQGITIKKKTPDILMVVNFFSPDGRYDDIYLSNYATIYVKDELLRVTGCPTSTTWASATTASAPGSTRRSSRRAA